MGEPDMHEEERRILSQAVDAASRLTGLEFSVEQARIRDFDAQWRTLQRAL